MPVGYTHYLIRKLGSAGLASFFRETHVIGEENVPLDGPVVLYEHPNPKHLYTSDADSLP